MRPALCLSLITLVCIALQPSSAHVHGEAKLDIAVDGNTLTIHLATPLDGLLGFEHAARTTAEKQAVQKLQTTLAQPAQLFGIAAEAGCTAQTPQQALPIFDGKASGDHHDLEADFRWQCTKPAALRAIDVRLFAAFPRLKHIKVQFFGPAGQKAGRLTPKQPRVVW